MDRRIRSAYRAEIAPGAGTLGRRRGQESQRYGAIDDFQRLDRRAPVRLGQGYWMLGESSGSGAVEQASAGNRLPEHLLDGETVDDRLQDGAAADNRA